MKKNRNILLASMLVAGFAIGGAAALNTTTASAAEDIMFQGVKVNSLVMAKGAGIRISDDNYGIRFQLNLSEEEYVALEEKGASYGIAIYPADYSYAVTESAIFAANSKATLVESEVLSDTDEDGTYDMWGSLVNIQPGNITREFVGIGYVKVNGEYKLAQAFEGNVANNTRSIYYVAQLAQDAASEEGATDSEKAQAAKAKEIYLDTFATTNYAYKVNHVYKDKEGNTVKTESETAYAALNSTVNVTPKANGWYKYDATQSTMSGKLYANGRTEFTAVYTDNSVSAKYNADYVKQNSGAITLDATKFDVQLAGLENVYVDGKEVAITPVSETEISVPVATGIHQIAVYDGDKCYYGDVKVADYEITDVASFAATGSTKSTYAVVTKDFTCDNTVIAPHWGSLNVIDGLGHTITNANMTYGFGKWAQGETQNMSADDALININFVNLRLGGGEYPLFAPYVAGVIENVNMSVTVPGRKWTHKWQALLCMNFTGGYMKNVNIDVTMTNAADREIVWRLYDDAKAYYGTNFENVSIKSNGKLAMVGEGWYGSTAPQITLTKSSWTNVKLTDKDRTMRYGVNEVDYKADYVMISNGKITLDATKVDAQLAGVEKVYVDEVEVAFTPVSATQISIPATVGEHEIGIYDGKAMYYTSIVVADYEITDQKSFIAMCNTTTTYAVVANDFTCDGTTVIAPHWWMMDVLDGLGHTITNASMQYGFCQWDGSKNYNMGAGDAIKNINFVNLKMGGGEYPLFGQTVGGGAIVENVNMSIIVPGRNWTSAKANWQGLLARYFIGMGDDRFVMRNVNIDVTMTNAADRENVWRLYDDANGYYGTVFENVKITTNGKLAMVGEGWHNSAAPQITLKNSSWTNVTLTDKDRTNKY